MQNEIDLAIVTMPVDKAQLVVKPLWSEAMVAIHPSSARNLPDKVTPEYVLRQALLLEHTRAGVHQLVMQWLSGHGATPRVRCTLARSGGQEPVASNLGMSIVPQMATSRSERDIVMRPLHPPLIRTLALIEHRSKPNEPAIEIVRNALLGLRDTDVVASPSKPARRSTRTAVKRRARRRP